VSITSNPITAVATISVDHASHQVTGPGAAIAQWPTAVAAEASGKLNDQQEMVNGRRRYSGRMNSWTSAIMASAAASPTPTVVDRLPFKANHAVLAVAGGPQPSDG